MKTLDTRDLEERKQELEDMRDSLDEAREALKEAQEALAAFDPDNPEVAPDDEAWYEKRDELQEAVSDAESDVDTYESDFGDDEREELAELENLESEISEWRHGETLILERDFEDYARQLAEDIGAISGKESWPLKCIDWERAAEELAMDYITVSYQGNDYLVRA